MATFNSSSRRDSLRRVAAVTVLALALIATIIAVPFAPLLVGGISAATLWTTSSTFNHETPPQQSFKVSDVRAQATTTGTLFVVITGTGRVATRWVPS